MKPNRKNYTLIELIVVLAIVAVLIGLVLPGFDRMVNGDKVTAAAKRLSSVLAHARSEAIISGRRVALFIPMAGESGFRDSYYNRSLCVARLDREDPTKIDLKQLNSVKWTFLPKGTIISHVSSVSAQDNTSAWKTTSWYEKKKTSAAPLWELAQGQLNSGALASKGPFTDAYASGSKPSGMYAIVFLPDGTMSADGSSVVNLFVTEGMYEGEELTVTNPNPSTNATLQKQPGNTMCIRVNGFTGRTRYQSL